MVKKPITCMNCDVHHDRYVDYRKIIKSMIKKVPKNELINLLVEMKILNKDYLTDEITWRIKNDRLI